MPVHQTCSNTWLRYVISSCEFLSCLKKAEKKCNCLLLCMILKHYLVKPCLLIHLTWCFVKDPQTASFPCNLVLPTKTRKKMFPVSQSAIKVLPWIIESTKKLLYVYVGFVSTCTYTVCIGYIKVITFGFRISKWLIVICRKNPLS